MGRAPGLFFLQVFRRTGPADGKFRKISQGLDLVFPSQIADRKGPHREIRKDEILTLLHFPAAVHAGLHK